MKRRAGRIRLKEGAIILSVAIATIGVILLLNFITRMHTVNNADQISTAVSTAQLESKTEEKTLSASVPEESNARAILLGAGGFILLAMFPLGYIFFMKKGYFDDPNFPRGKGRKYVPRNEVTFKRFQTASTGGRRRS